MSVNSPLPREDGEGGDLDQQLDAVQRLMEDEAYQNSMLDASEAPRVAVGSVVDELPDASGVFGLDPCNPIPVNGPLGAITYLSCLKTSSGERTLFQRVAGTGDVDAYELVSYSGGEWFLLFVDIYHPRRSRKLPAGFESGGKVSMFSGFADCSAQFPDDYAARVSRLEASVRPAYAPESRFSNHFGAGTYQRPLLHWAKLEAIALRGFRFD